MKGLGQKEGNGQHGRLENIFCSDLDLFTIGIFYCYWIEKFERCRAQGLLIIS